MKKILFIFILLTCSVLVNAQVNSTFFESKAELSKSYPRLKTAITQSVPQKKMRSFDVAKLLKEDKQNEGVIDIPFRFGYGFDVSYTLEDGVWEKYDGNNVWTLQIKSDGAYSLNFIFDELYLADSAQLFIFSANGTMVYGPVTKEQNIQPDEIFLTDIVAGDEVIIQLIEPAVSEYGNKSFLKISKVVHGYKNMFASLANGDNITQSLGQSANCNNDVACYSAWTNESNAVAMVLLSNGTEWCSGSLLNNTSQDYRPYFLSAFHCIDSNSDGTLSTTERTNAQSWMFRFKYKKTTCNGSTVASYITTNSATFRAAWVNTDFILMELKRMLFIADNSFLGWDRMGNNPASGTCIHHPQGDVMKISFDNNPITSNTNPLSWFGSSFVSPANTHWTVSFDNGIVEPISSGSPLLNQNKLVVGQLHGGTSNCTYNNVYYGQFHLSWTGGGTDDTRLSNWLDPTDSGALTLNTIKYPTISGTSQMCAGSSATFTVSNVPSTSTFIWACSSNFTKTSESGNTATFSASSNGNGYVSVLVGNVIISYNVFVGTLAGNITGPYDLSCNCMITINQPGDYRFIATGISALVSSNNIMWELTPPSPEFTYLYSGTNPVINFSESGNYTLRMRWLGTCGYSDYAVKNIVVPNNIPYSYSAAYPNPAGNELIIDKIEEDNSMETAAINTQSIKGKTSEIRVLLYSHSTAQLVYNKTYSSSEKQIKIDTSKLPNGIYHLNIIENGEKIKEQTVVIQH
jgi:hypothetical protein